MATGTTTSSSTITDISNYCIFGELCYGSNGEVSGAPEVNVGAANQTPATARRQWDADMTDGLSAGPTPVSFVAEAGGGTDAVKWAVDEANPSPLNYSGATYGTITRVRIKAGVQTTALVSWTELSVKFYRNGRLTEAYPTSGTSSGPSVDTQSATAPVTAEQLLEVLPEQSTNSKIIVSGKVTLAVPAGVQPDVNDLFAQVFVDTSTCTT